MITNILLGLILGVVITSFIILNKKINKIDEYTRKTLSNTNFISTNVDNSYKMINIILDRVNNFVLRYNESKNLLETKVNNNTEYFDKKLNDITTLIYDVNEHISVQHNNTRDDIKKLAKISSKKKQASKQSKSINKQ